MDSYITVHISNLSEDDINDLAFSAMKFIIMHKLNDVIVDLPSSITHEEEMKILTAFQNNGSRIFIVDDYYDFDCDIKSYGIESDIYNFLVDKTVRALEINRFHFIVTKTEEETQEALDSGTAILLCKSENWNLLIDVRPKIII